MGTSQGAKKAWEKRKGVVKTTIRVKQELWKAVLHRSIDEDITSQELVERALEMYLRQKGGHE